MTCNVVIDYQWTPFTRNVPTNIKVIKTNGGWKTSDGKISGTGDRPSEISYDEKWRPRTACYYGKHGLHRKDGPAFLQYSIHTGKLLLEGWFLDGELGRKDGSKSCWIRYGDKGEIISRTKYIV